MLHIEIQKGKEAMMELRFQQEFVGTSACTKRLMMDTKVYRQMISRDTYFSDSWFSGVKTAEESMTERVDYCGPVKTRHKGLCLPTLEKLMKYFPGESYLVLKINPRVSGDIPLTDIG